jgi:deaminated glutathione amidase
MRIALCQMTSGIDPARNAGTLVAAVHQAADGGADMLFTPEMSGLLDSNRERSAAYVTDQDSDPVLAAVQDAARERKIWVHLGSLAVLGEGEGSRRLNRGFVIDSGGVVRAHYDKLHLFDVDLPTGESWRESKTYVAGQQAILVDTPIGELGLSICYDLRFPALYTALSSAGAQILAVPAAFTVPTGEAHWHLLLRARAIENAAWVVAAAQVGPHEDGRKTFGHSLVVDPWGNVVLDMAETPGIGFAEIDPDLTRDVRRRIPVADHRRGIPEVVQKS